MNQNERLLFHYCKTGELNLVKETLVGLYRQLVEKEDVNLNIRDCWDSTPLYYACLCGYLELVEYLLENGARCEANSFDGERCLYGALTDQIRNVLRNSKVRVTKLDQYELFLERLYELSPYYDVTFEIKDRIFKAHKCILAARSAYFRRKFETMWKKRKWIIGTHELIVPEAFEAILKYIYTDHFSTLKIYFGSCLRLAKLFKLTDLIEEFNKKLYTIKVDEKDTMESSNNPSDTLNSLNILENSDIKFANYDTTTNTSLPIDEADIFLIGKFGANTKLSHTITIEPKDRPISSLPSSNSQLSRISLDFKQLAYYSLPLEIRNSLLTKTGSLDLQRIVDLTHDMCFELSDEATVFNVHKAFIAERCDYFKTFLNDPFKEISQINETTNISKLMLKEISTEVLVEIIFFIYSNSFSVDKLDENVLYDVLIVADLYLLPGLKRKCAQELAANYMSKENIFDLLKMSRVYELKKLEFSCIFFLAEHIFEFKESQQLREIILEDANKLKQRQETDTIDIIDDLRYAINEIASVTTLTNLVNYNERVTERDYRLGLIDAILNELNLEC